MNLRDFWVFFSFSPLQDCVKNQEYSKRSGLEKKKRFGEKEAVYWYLNGIYQMRNEIITLIFIFSITGLRLNHQYWHILTYKPIYYYSIYIVIYSIYIVIYSNI